jgi:AraC-like DNA-binding protein
MGQTTIQYVANWCMHLANEMLQTQHSSVGQVAEQLRYRGETAFRRAFKRVRGVAPGEVRRKSHPA